MTLVNMMLDYDQRKKKRKKEGWLNVKKSEEKK